MELTVTIRHEQGAFWSEVAELPGCFASARTLTELREALGEAIGVYLWDTPARVSAGELVEGSCAVQVALTPPGPGP